MLRTRAAAMVFALLLGLGAGSALAATFLSSIAGVYHQRFREGTVDSGSFDADDVLEIMPVGNGDAYFRIHLDFYNGHTCGLSGIAHAEGETLTYRSGPNSGYDVACTFTIAREGDALRLHDLNSGCMQTTCGMRGSYEGMRFPLSAKRCIRYTSRILGSREYAAALAEAGRRP